KDPDSKPSANTTFEYDPAGPSAELLGTPSTSTRASGTASSTTPRRARSKRAPAAVTGRATECLGRCEDMEMAALLPHGSIYGWRSAANWPNDEAKARKRRPENDPRRWYVRGVGDSHPHRSARTIGSSPLASAS